MQGRLTEIQSQLAQQALLTASGSDLDCANVTRPSDRRLDHAAPGRRRQVCWASWDWISVSRPCICWESWSRLDNPPYVESYPA